MFSMLTTAIRDSGL